MERITLELEPKEVLMLQELAQAEWENGTRPQWQFEIINNLIGKAQEAYQKPHITRKELKAQVEEEKLYWSNAVPGLPEAMAKAKEAEFMFLYEVDP